MTHEEIIQSVRDARQELAEEGGYDLDRIVQLLRERQQLAGRTVVRLAPRQPLVDEKPAA